MILYTTVGTTTICHLDELVAVSDRVRRELDRVAVVVELERQFGCVEGKRSALVPFCPPLFRQRAHEKDVLAYLFTRELHGPSGGEIR